MHRRACPATSGNWEASGRGEDQPCGSHVPSIGLLMSGQISLPVASIAGQGPIGMSIIGKKASDEALLDICVSVAGVLGI